MIDKLRPAAWMYRRMTTAEGDRVEFTRTPWAYVLTGYTETPLYTREAVRAEQAAEVERLKKLIEATSAHFLRLNTDHPIMWDGAIDAAMEAVCLEVERQAAELAKFKALAETLAGAGEAIADAAYHGDECPMNTTGAYCNCGYDAAYEKWCQSLTSYKEQRDA